ncbi:unnamed protein product [Alopecurus aequalis]
MVGEEVLMANPVEVGHPADAAAPIQEYNSGASSADQKSRHLLPMRMVEQFLSHEFKSTPLLGDDDDCEHGEMWREAIDSFNQLRKELVASQAKLRDEYVTKGYVEVNDGYHDKGARFEKAFRDLEVLAEKLFRDEGEGSDRG